MYTPFCLNKQIKLHARKTMYLFEVSQYFGTDMLACLLFISKYSNKVETEKP